jgi:hypothetical protein
MSSENTPYNMVAFKASHNSYDRDEQPITTQLQFNRNDPSNCGCSGLELDIWQADNAWQWSVSHLGGYSSKAENQLSAYLRQLRSWSDQNQGHRVIELHIDIKNTPMSNAEFPAQFDAYLREYLPSSMLFTPSGLMTPESSDLVACAQQTGWPALNLLAGKFIVCLTGNEPRKATYALTQPRDRLCFADLELETDPVQFPDFNHGSRVIMNYHLYDRLSDNWIPQLQEMARQPGFLTRGFVLNDSSIWRKAQEACLNIMATDKVSGQSWAQNGSEPFRTLSVPAGSPKRDAA